jgi:hypothetical protein
MTSYLPSAIKQFNYYKSLGDKTLSVLSLDELKYEFKEDSNSIAIIVKHLSGNMHSRWTNFLAEDGEKTWRNRDDEFIDTYNSKEEIIIAWNKAWDCLFDAITALNNDELENVIYIRNHGHTVVEAINRQMMHYAYHIGQMVFLGKLIKEKNWQSLSIPKGKSKDYNKEKFSKEKNRIHFTEDL